MYERAPIEPGMIPSSPFLALTAPLRVTSSVLAEVPLARAVVVVAVHRHLTHLERPQLLTHHAQHRIHHRAAVFRRVVLRPGHRLDVVVEVIRSLRRGTRDHDPAG